MYRLHICLGLALALYAVLIGLTGAALVFRDPMVRASRPDLYASPTAASAIDSDRALSLVRAAYPGWTPLTATFPNAYTPYLMFYSIRDREAREVYVTADGSRIVGERDPSTGTLAWIARLHTSLLGGRTGRRINGGLACGLLLLAVSGPILWRRRKYLHSAIGLACAPFLLWLCLTGAYFVWPQQYVSVIGSVLATEPVVRIPPSSGSSLSVAQLVERATAAIPDKAVYRVSIPNSPSAPVQLTYLDGTPDEFHRVSTISMNPVTGVILQVTRNPDRSAGSALIGWLSASHFGVFGGFPIRLLWVLGGISVAFLAITGIAARLTKMLSKMKAR